MAIAPDILRAARPPTVRRLALALALGSAALLLGAFYFQYVAGLAPCPLCLDQRYAHGAVIVLALGAAAVASRPMGGGPVGGGPIGGRFARLLLWA
ncbi:MAG: disulfide bond formation protein B, partial [Alphaproteobacteria bacterium]